MLSGIGGYTAGVELVARMRLDEFSRMCQASAELYRWCKSLRASDEPRWVWLVGEMMMNTPLELVHRAASDSRSEFWPYMGYQNATLESSSGLRRPNLHMQVNSEVWKIFLEGFAFGYPDRTPRGRPTPFPINELTTLDRETFVLPLDGKLYNGDANTAPNSIFLTNLFFSDTDLKTLVQEAMTNRPWMDNVADDAIVRAITIYMSPLRLSVEHVNHQSFRTMNQFNHMPVEAADDGKPYSLLRSRLEPTTTESTRFAYRRFQHQKNRTPPEWIERLNDRRRFDPRVDGRFGLWLEAFERSTEEFVATYEAFRAEHPDYDEGVARDRDILMLLQRVIETGRPFGRRELEIAMREWDSFFSGVPENVLRERFESTRIVMRFVRYFFPYYPFLVHHRQPDGVDAQFYLNVVSFLDETFSHETPNARPDFFQNLGETYFGAHTTQEEAPVARRPSGRLWD